MNFRRTKLGKTKQDKVGVKIKSMGNPIFQQQILVMVVA